MVALEENDCTCPNFNDNLERETDIQIPLDPYLIQKSSPYPVRKHFLLLLLEFIPFLSFVC